jgi:hypothetical protein
VGTKGNWLDHAKGFLKLFWTDLHEHDHLELVSFCSLYALTKENRWTILSPEKSMPDNIPSDPNRPPEPPAPPEAPLRLPPEAMVAEPRPAPTTLYGGEARRPVQVPRGDVPRPLVPRQPGLSANVWGMIAAVAGLLLVLVFIATRSGKKAEPVPPAAPEPQAGEGTGELSGYAAYVARNKALIQKRYEQQVLTAEPFAGEAPLAVRPAGPLLSPEGDPQLAALAEALAIRVRIMSGVQTTTRGGQTQRAAKGEYRGFRVTALEKLERGAVSYSEVTVVTPGKRTLKTVNRVLQALEKGDLAGVLAEVQAAGLEFAPLPVPAGRDVFRAQLLPVRPWGKAVEAGLLISGREVGAVALDAPVARIAGSLMPSFRVLKRKVLVGESYRDVFKVIDAGGDPLFYVYEKDGRVWGITIVSPVFRTAAGIGIGSTLDRMRLEYPQVRISHTAKGAPIARVEGIEGSFILQSDEKPEVIAVLVGQSPEIE